MQTRQRPLRPMTVGNSARRGPYVVGSKKRDEDYDGAESDRKAGRGLIYLLAAVAVGVVLLIGIRSSDLRGPTKIDRADNAVVAEDSRPFQPVGNRDIQPANTLQESEQIRKLVEDNQQAIRESYPIELLSDDNGTRAKASQEGDGDDEEESVEEKEQEYKEQELRATRKEEAIVQTEAKKTSTHAKRVESLGNFLFSDGEEYEKAPFITLPNDPELGQPFSGMWKLLNVHEEYFKTHAHKRYIPRLAQTITRQQFHEVFRKTSTPVIIPFEHARALGFLTQATTIEDLQRRYPYDPSSGPKTYNKYSLTRSTVDWGPAVYAIANDAKLEKIAVGVRNFPRNLHMSSRNMAVMGVSRPPYIQKQRFQAASAWFGTSTSDTKLHHDCCDNFVMMIVGTKRWFIAPPTDWRTLRPVRCEGDNQSLCWASVPYPNAKDLPEDKQRVLDALNSVTIDLKAGEMLYLPAGWWHHITNLGPTVMMNHWTYGCENVALQLDLEPTRRDRPDFKSCERNAREEQSWRMKMDAEDFGKASVTN